MNCVNETWKDIPGYENLYQISSTGRVKSLNYRRTSEEKILRPGLNSSSSGYYFVSLCKNGEWKYFRVHRLVALSFIPNPENKECVDHINGDRLDNRVENLRWCTQKENHNFPLAKKNKSQSLINNPKLLKPILQIDKNTGEVIKEYPSIKDASKQLGIDQSQISKCAKGKEKSAGGFIWRYK